MGTSFEAFVQLKRSLEKQEDAACDQDEITSGEGMSENREKRCGERHEPGHDREQSDAH